MVGGGKGGGGEGEGGGGEGEGGGGEGGVGSIRGPQSVQSVPTLQSEYSAPGPPSSHSPSEAQLHVSVHCDGGGGGGGGGGGAEQV